MTMRGQSARISTSSIHMEPVAPFSPASTLRLRSPADTVHSTVAFFQSNVPTSGDEETYRVLSVVTANRTAPTFPPASPG